MSVLIRGMSSYECCADCEFCGGLIMPAGIYVCECPPTRGMDITMAIEEDCKHPDCPLVELPKKHGRLIDADEFMADICRSINEMSEIGIAVDGEYLWCKLNDALKNAPTIVEAEGEDV